MKILAKKEFFDKGFVWAIQPPMKRIVQINYEDYELGRRRSYISLPHVVYKISYLKVSKRFKLNRLSVGLAKSENFKKLYYPPLGNVYEDLSICMGNVKITTDSLDSLIKLTVDKFWKSEFNSAVEFIWDKYDTDSMLNWEEKTKTSPNWIPSSELQVAKTRKAFFAELYNDYVL